ncbi:monocarboxylate transporter 13-like [Lingula anatina]|uniref:Monocarboxylate transporter 13-like n=1 Tax=Lingula anatina TaxID=7574 RepID=A0A1S3I054_LINAN|nr:monocarboxylate transporter 13-like [Lingula anatina]|eukprot:XP_013390729.1 monocarboxylate transporter 13-like [Lingula anatina]
MVDTPPNTPALKTAEQGGYPNDGFENDTIDGELQDDNSDCDVKDNSFKHLEELREIGAGEENGYSDKPIRLGSATGSSFTDSKRASIEGSPRVQTDSCMDWLVVLASFLTHFIVCGILYSFGVFYITLLNEFEETKSATSWVGSIQIALSWIMGPIASSLSDKIGHRAVGVIGSVLAATGIGVSSLASNVYLLYFTFGVISGIGFALMYFPSIVSVQDHFEKRKSVAMGIAVCGSGVGTFSMAPLIEYLIESITWRYALLVLAGCLLLGIGLNMLFVPPKLINKEENETEQTLSSNDKTTMFFKSMFHISLLRRVDVVLWLVCNLIIQIGLVVPYTYIPDKAVDVGIEVKNAAFLMSIVGIANTVGRVVMGLFADFRCANRRYMLGISVMITGVMVVILPFMKEYGVIATVCTFYGLSLGKWNSDHRVQLFLA